MPKAEAIESPLNEIETFHNTHIIRNMKLFVIKVNNEQHVI